MTGSIWIYSIRYSFDPSNPDSPGYCNPVLYNFAYWVTTTVYIVIFAVTCGMCLIGLCVSCLCGPDGADQEMEIVIDD